MAIRTGFYFPTRAYYSDAASFLLVPSWVPTLSTVPPVIPLISRHQTRSTRTHHPTPPHAMNAIIAYSAQPSVPLRHEGEAMFEELDFTERLGKDVCRVVMGRNRKNLHLLLVDVVVQEIDSAIDVFGSLAGVEVLSQINAGRIVNIHRGSLDGSIEVLVHDVTGSYGRVSTPQALAE